MKLNLENVAVGSTIVLTLSGGADSVALCLKMMEVSKKYPLVIAHFNHGLRTESEQEAEFCKQFASDNDIPFYYKKWTDRSESGNIHSNARDARYTFFQEVASATNASYIATAHHQDDQAETVLDRMLRGSGQRGLCAIRHIAESKHGNAKILRPMLDFRKHDLKAYLIELGQKWYEDVSNSNQKYKRSRLRHNVIPVLNEATGCDVTPILSRISETMCGIDDSLNWVVDQQWKKFDVVVTEDEISFNVKEIKEWPHGLLNCLFDRIVKEKGLSSDIEWSKNARLMFINLIKSDRGYEINIHKMTMLKKNHHLVIKTM